MGEVTKNIQVEVIESVLFIKLNRADQGNSLDITMAKEITAAVQLASKPKSKIRVIEISGHGNNFCTGANLNWMFKAGQLNSAKNKKDFKALQTMYETLATCPVPILGHIHGKVFGGGVGLTAVCDIVACESNTVFSMPEARLGLVPGLISYFVKQKIGTSRFLEYALTGKEFSAEQAVTIGLAHFCGSKSQVQNFLKNSTQMILKNSPESLKEIKKYVYKIDQLKKELTLLGNSSSKMRATPEAQKRIKAYLRKAK